MDNNGNRQLDARELQYGLGDMGISLDEEQLTTVLKFFDRDGSGSVNYDEFLRAIRVYL